MNLNDFFRKNLSLKIFSIVIAAVLWFYAASSQRVELRMKTEITFINAPDSIVIASVNSQSADILFSGKSRDFLIMKLLGKRPECRIDLSSCGKGKYTFPLLGDSVDTRSSGNIRVIAILYPEKVEVETDSLFEKDVIVTPVITGKPHEEYALSGDVEVAPQKVRIYGAKSILSKMTSVETKEINIENAKRSVLKNSSLNIPNAHIKSEIHSVSVKIPVDGVTSRDFPGVPVIFINKSPSFDVSPDSFSVDIQLSGPKKLLNEILAGEISPMIDLSVISSRGEYTLEITIPKKKYVETIAVSPSFVKVTAK